MSGRRTLWEEGHRPGRLVVWSGGVVALLAVLLDVAVNGNITLLYDIVFVLVCVAGALAVRPRDFFVVGVFPPLLMAGTVLVLAIVARDTVADGRDGIIQALVSGLAHHAGALVVGYALTLGLLALRNVAIRNSGAIRRGAAPSRTSSHATN
ncbi:MAG: DUF6542 domain-containing protein [Nocardioidaceae bacterium]